MKKLNIEEIKEDGSLETLVSTFDKNDGMIRDEVSETGPNLVTFSGILKYDTFPLSSIIKDILEIGQRGMGCPIEIEFAVDLNQNSNDPPTFSLLQLRPLVPSHEQSHVSWDEDIDLKKVFIKSDRALGNCLVKAIKTSFIYFSDYILYI